MRLCLSFRSGLLNIFLTIILAGIFHPSAHAFRHLSSSALRPSRSFGLRMSSSNSVIVTTDQFAFRQFPKTHAETSTTYGGSKMSVTCEAFESICNEYISANGASDACLKEGYAPFCKHIFIPNTAPDGTILCEADVNFLEVTPENESLLRTEYEARNEKEVRLCV